MPTRNVLIVGSSLAGLHTAEALRARGYDGAITMVDAEPEPRYDRPPLSKDYLSKDHLSAERPAGDGPLLRSPAALAVLGADWHLGDAAVSLNPRGREIGLASGRMLGYDKLVIATGVSPAWPAAWRIPSAVTLRTRGDADRLRAKMTRGTRLAVIGAGFIGLEVAATFRSLDVEVDVVEAEQAPLTRQLGPVVGRAVQAMHAARGVRFHLGTRVTAVRQNPDSDGAGCQVELRGGAVIAADVLLVAVGSAPAVGWLRGSGLDLDNGIACDGHLLAAPDVYAVGDVARWPHPLAGRPVRIEHWTNAVEQAAHVARRITDAGGASEPFAPVPYFWSDQYGSKLQAYGFPGPADEVEVVAGDLDGGWFAALYRNGGRLTAAVGIGSPRQVLAGRRQLVADLAAEGALS